MGNGVWPENYASILESLKAFELTSKKYIHLVKIIAWIVLLAPGSIDPGVARAQATPPAAYLPSLSPIRTDSPRDTLATFLRLHDEMEAALVAYTTHPSRPHAARLAILSDQMVALIDLHQVPEPSRREVGIKTGGYLMDIFGRIPHPDLAALPDEAELDQKEAVSYRIERTPLRIMRMSAGDREGEYLFSPSTVQVAPRFFRQIANLPLQTRLDITSYTDFSPHLTGPLFPATIVRQMPAPLRGLWLGTPVWKIIAVTLFVMGLALLIAGLQRILAAHTPAARLAALGLRAILPLAILGAVSLALPYFSHQINISGAFAAAIATVQTLTGSLAYAWLFWLGVRMLFEWVIRSPRIPDESLDANLLRLVSGLIGIIGVAVILAFGGQNIGLPIMSVLAGLGIGGLAVALALRPTLENLVGGVMLYIDRPVRVGDFCSFGDEKGTVEGIGIRSTKLRAINRTLISIPNAQFADMQIVNWAECDQMLIDEAIGLRYETEPDQLRYLLAQLRKMLHAHPRIDSTTVRVRFTGYGDSALNISIRVYAETREWNDFFAIREDILLRVYDIVTEAGSGFAFPSQTLYMSRDTGLDAKSAGEAKATVAAWRKNKQLPFPRLSREEIERLEGTLDYPPYGSPEAGGENLDLADAAERLSFDPDPAEANGADVPRPEEPLRKA
jgi:MscS family membrane protein